MDGIISQLARSHLSTTYQHSYTYLPNGQQIISQMASRLLAEWLELVWLLGLLGLLHGDSFPRDVLAFVGLWRAPLVGVASPGQPLRLLLPLVGSLPL